MTGTFPIVTAFAVVSILFCLFPAPSRGDEIVLDNGSRILGTVTGLIGDLLTVTTDYSEPIKIKKGRVAKIVTDHAVDLHLESGEILKGELGDGATGEVIVAAGGAGKRRWWHGVTLRPSTPLRPSAGKEMSP